MAKINDGNFIGGDNLYSFLMIGQSNMAGRGEISDVEPINNFRCYMLRNGRFLRMSEPVNPDRAIFTGTFHSGISLAASFADELSKSMKMRVGLIPCADGGTGIDEWQPGEILYDHAVFMARLAIRTSRFAGIIWHQGESDCVSEELFEAYKPKFLNMVRSLRRDLNAENLPFIAGEISEYTDESWNIGERAVRFNRMLSEIKSELHCFAVASSHGLGLKDDGIHFSSRSARELGKRYCEEYLKICK